AASGLCAAYVVTGPIGLLLDPVSGFATLVWPPTGIALFALLRGGPSLWPPGVIGALWTNPRVGAPPGVSTAIAVGNTLEAVVGATLVRGARIEPALARIRDVLAFMFLAGVASTVLPASIGVASLWAGAIIARPEVFPTFRAWWVGDALG